MQTVSGPDAGLSPKSRKALVTIVMGDEFRRVWNTLSRPGWEAYAARFGYDLIVIDDYLDPSDAGRAKPVPWQKLLIAAQPWAQLYETLVWLDADIVIGPAAPDIATSIPDSGLIGVAVVGDQLSAAEQHIYAEKTFGRAVHPNAAAGAWTTFHQANYANDGLDGGGKPMLNTGVLVLNPATHADLLLSVYGCENRSRFYEQSYLSLAIHRSGLGFRLSPRFNWTVFERTLLDFGPKWFEDQELTGRLYLSLRNDLQSKAYFLHFAGSMGLMTLLCDVLERGLDILGAVPSP